MVSMVETSRAAHNDEPMDSVAPKSEPILEGSVSESLSTPEAEAETLTQDVAQTQKRKGGRKPIYATSEERKQRNRQAQAAFRERRTEYIRQLESTIKRNEDTLQTLQQNHRSAADECLMLRYKNSLLERVLLEKGIDVQAELRLKAAPSAPPKSSQSQMMPKPPSSGLERAAVNRSSNQRPQAGIAPKEPFGVSQHRDAGYSAPSPQFQPTPSSHASPPSHTKSPGFALQGTISPADQHRSQALPQPRSFAQSSPPMGMHQTESSDPKPTMAGNRGTRATGAPSAFYPSPFQRHYDQLEREYDAQADFVDEGEHPVEDTSSYLPGLPQSTQSGSHGVSNFNPPSGEGSNGGYGNTGNLLGNYDPMLDADPFGLSASMHFQTPFSYEQNHTRH